MISLSTFFGCFGLVTLIESNTILVIVSMILRALQGFTRVISAIPSRSLLAILEPDEKMKYMGFLEGALTVGDGLGPILGSVLYELVGFIYMFMIMGLFHFIYIPFMMLAMPRNIDYDGQDTVSLARDNEVIPGESKISVFKLLSNRLIILCSIADFLSHIAYNYFEPLL